MSQSHYLNVDSTGLNARSFTIPVNDLPLWH